MDVVFDMYGGFAGMYPGGMLVQTYPGGPLVAAIPVPVPVQTMDWHRAANGEMGYYYALAYPPETGSMLDENSRRDSVESFQVTNVFCCC